MTVTVSSRATVQRMTIFIKGQLDRLIRHLIFMNIQRWTLHVTLYKRGEMIYFSQIDIMHLLERTLRRMNLPLLFTQGFNPHVKMSFGPALKLGVEGKVEVTFYFTQEILSSQFKENLQNQLPAGLDIQ